MEEQAIKRVRGVQLTRGGEEAEGWLPAGAAHPQRTAVRTATCSIAIAFDGHGWLLVCDSEDPEFCSDTWHQSLEEAEYQARIEFGIEAPQWETVS